MSPPPGFCFVLSGIVSTLILRRLFFGIVLIRPVRDVSVLSYANYRSSMPRDIQQRCAIQLALTLACIWKVSNAALIRLPEESVSFPSKWTTVEYEPFKGCIGCGYEWQLSAWKMYRAMRAAVKGIQQLADDDNPMRSFCLCVTLDNCKIRCRLIIPRRTQLTSPLSSTFFNFDRRVGSEKGADTGSGRREDGRKLRDLGCEQDPGFPIGFPGRTPVKWPAINSEELGPFHSRYLRTWPLGQKPLMLVFWLPSFRWSIRQSIASAVAPTGQRILQHEESPCLSH